MASEPFIPHRLLRNAHAQTIAGWALPRRVRLPRPEDRLIEVAAGAQVLCRCHWQQQNSGTAVPSQQLLRQIKPKLTLLLVHGLEGSSESGYMLGTAEKAFAAGMNVVRMNIRNCGGTERLSRTLYHSGLSQDVAAVAEHLSKDHRISRIALAGFSLGGNQVLKLAGEWGSAPPKYICAVAAVSPAMDLDASCDLLHRPFNRLYEWQFLRSLRRKLKLKATIFPESNGFAHGRRFRSMREFDDLVTAPAFGFAGAADYYARASASAALSAIEVPALVIFSTDDPFICVLPQTRERLRANRHITILECRHGGHCGFIGPRFTRWAEEQIVAFAAKADA